jgi:hypothetical protein
MSVAISVANERCFLINRLASYSNREEVMTVFITGHLLLALSENQQQASS